jgi:hypothetical protein
MEEFNSLNFESRELGFREIEKFLRMRAVISLEDPY